jgi:ribosomal protein S18 acetylase RimI-like enzyme
MKWVGTTGRLGAQLSEAGPAEIVELQCRCLGDHREGILISNYSVNDILQLAHADGSAVLAARSASTLVGYCLVSDVSEYHALVGASRHALPRHTSARRYILQIATRRGYHRQGVGTALLAAAKQLRSTGLVTDVLLAPVCNEVSLHFFERNGFESIGELELPSYRTFGATRTRVFEWVPQ